MKIFSLDGKWNLSGQEQGIENAQSIKNIEADVPGCVQLALARVGILPDDLYMGENILSAEKFETWEWWYEKSFVAPEERENVYLVFEGVDCIAEYFINEVNIGHSENMFVSHEFEIGKYLKNGENSIRVHILSPVLAAHDVKYDISAFQSWCGSAVETVIRRAPHSYGWDIMPRAVTSGIWRGVRIEVRDKVRIDQLYCRTTNNTCKIFYEINADYRDLSSLEVEFEGSCKESNFYLRKKINNSKTGTAELPICSPKEWMPFGYGEANIYDAQARIYKNGALVHTESFSFGLRTVKLERTDVTDGESGCFRFLINGVEVMCKGTNWVPMDAFHSRDAVRYAKALELVRDLGCNIVRCWGGNVYEDHEFFDFCDRNGIMVWQDFSMACHAYPMNDDFKRLICDEVESVVRKLRNHPSIIIWAGDNEVDVMNVSFNIDPSTNKITREWIPSVIERNDLDRPYLPSSPYISRSLYDDYSPDKLPEDHRWGPRDYYKSDFYKNCRAHFISETGYHGCPSESSIRKFITPDRVWHYKDNPEWILHSSDQNGNDSRVMLMDKQVRQLFGEVPNDIENYVIASQISQAEAKKFFIEHTRVGRPKKSGIIWWNAIDGWPQMSDAVVDYYYDRKLAYYYIKASQRPFIMAIDEISDWQLSLVACNDTLSCVSGYVKVTDAESGDVLFDSEFSALENSSTKVGRIPLFYSEQRFLIIEWSANGERGINHYLCGYPPISLKRYIEFLKKYIKEL